MNCPNCGVPSPSGVVQCASCGRPLAPPPVEQEVEAAVRAAAHEVKRLTKAVVREAKPVARKAVAVTKGAVRGAIDGMREPGPAASSAPPPPPPPGATGDARPRKPADPASESKS